MKKMLLLVITLLPLAALGGDYQKDYEEIATDRTLSDAGRLHRLFDLDWERGLHESPEFATAIGYPGLDDRWTDESPEAIEKRKAEMQWPLAVITTIDRAKLPKGSLALPSRSVSMSARSLSRGPNAAPMNAVPTLSCPSRKSIEWAGRTRKSTVDSIKGSPGCKSCYAEA